MGPKGGRPTKSDTLAIEQRRARVAEAYLRGQYQHEIAQRERVDRTTITHDLKAIQAAWKAAAIRDLDAHKERELARLDQLERTYWQAWERSLSERQKTRTKKTEGKGATAEASLEKEQRDGDPRFLEGVRSCIADRCKLLGLIVQKGDYRMDATVRDKTRDDAERDALLAQRYAVLDHAGEPGPAPDITQPVHPAGADVPAAALPPPGVP